MIIKKFCRILWDYLKVYNKIDKKMKFIDTINEIILEQRILDNIRDRYVGDGEGKIPEDIYNRIVTVAENKVSYIVWLVKMVALGNIKSEDVYKFKGYLVIFNRFKHLYKEKDISRYVTKSDVDYFKENTISIRDRDIEVGGGDTNYVSLTDMKKLEDVGIKYHGISEGYQVFEVPNDLKDDRNAWKVYSNVLGRCAGRKSGEGIDLCTIASFSNFSNYLYDHPGSSYFVLFNLGDKQSPYQFHYESGQFMDKNDTMVI